MLFSRYLQQLVMESLGKEKDLDGKVVHQGIAVYGNKGSTDQHAYVQQLRDGREQLLRHLHRGAAGSRRARSLEVEPGATSGRLPARASCTARGARSTRTAASRSPSRCRDVDARARSARSSRCTSAPSGFYASLVNINAYHQPGVEAGKKAADAVLDAAAQAARRTCDRHKGGAGARREELAAPIGAARRGGDGVQGARAPGRQPRPRRAPHRRQDAVRRYLVGSVAVQLLAGLGARASGAPRPPWPLHASAPVSVVVVPSLQNSDG